MKIITKTEIVSAVPARWAWQYPNDHETAGDKRAIGANLLALDPGFTAEQVNQIIGNDSWTKLECDVCGDDVEAVAVVTPQTHESERSLNVCLLCLDTTASEISNRGVA